MGAWRSCGTAWCDRARVAYARGVTDRWLLFEALEERRVFAYLGILTVDSTTEFGRRFHARLQSALERYQ